MNNAQISPHFWHTLHVAIALFFLSLRVDTLCTSGFVDDVIFVHNWPGKGNASREFTQRNQPDGNTGRTASESDVMFTCYCRKCLL